MVFAISMSSVAMSSEMAATDDKSAKIDICVKNYILKQSKQHSKSVQDTLYNLIHNFDQVVERLYGKKITVDNISHNEKLEILANIQCEMYYNMGLFN